MAKAKDKSSKTSKEQSPLVEEKTKRLILGVAFLTTGLVLTLALFGLAGPAGGLVDRASTYLFGLGEFMIPAGFFLLGAAFLLRPGTNFYLATILGVGFLVVSLLGILDELKPGSAGVLGKAFGSVSNLFGFWASLVILGALAVTGILLSFESYFLQFFKSEGEKSAAPPMVITPPEIISSPPEVKREAKPEPPPLEEKTIVFEDSPLPKAGFRARVSGDETRWLFPPLDILHGDKSQPEVSDINTNAKIIQKTLANFGIPVEMAGVHIGPTVTQYTLKPAQGVKLAKIFALQNDLALALAAHPIRIEAPIPGKALVGIEIPNKTKSLVRLRNLLEELSLRDGSPGLVFPLGRDVRGQAVFADLAKMPHLLIAGATGSGKSLFIHALISTFAFRIPPQHLRLLLVDPKRVELSQYEDIPYLLSPVITDGRKAIQALRWAISEMERRYDLLLSRKARDIFSYNQKVSGGEILPFIVIFIDELADLMAAYGRDIEGAIVRLSQMARATGIHLVVSTQRPSVEVITGLIKANITSRVAFQVASQVDSRTILDMAGAEKLLGSGDMLFVAADTPKPRRLQAPFISEEEVRRVVSFVKKQGEAQDLALAEELPEEAIDFPSGEDDVDTYDELYPQAYEVVVVSKKASASLLQRRLKVGYARAARLLDILEAKGVIGPGRGAKPREVYVKKEEDY